MKRRSAVLRLLMAGAWLFMAAAVALVLVLAASGVGTTLVWRHVVGHRVTVVVTDCQDRGRGATSCRGTEVGGPHPSARVSQLPYQPSSIGSLRSVWEDGGSAVVDTPWGALWFDLLGVAAIAAAVTGLRRRRRRRVPSGRGRGRSARSVGP